MIIYYSQPPEYALSHLNNDHFFPTVSEITYCQSHMHINLSTLSMTPDIIVKDPHTKREVLGDE